MHCETYGSYSDADEDNSILRYDVVPTDEYFSVEV